MSICVLISGNGSNLQALIDAKLPINAVISNKKDAYGLQRAQQANIPTDILTLFSYKSRGGRPEFDKALASLIVSKNVKLVVLAGFMLILSQDFLSILEENSIGIINLHPALPGQFDGINAIERAFDAYEQGKIDHSGVMIHWVIKDVDRGEPIVIRQIPFINNDTLEQFESRLHAVEHEAIVEGTRQALKELSSK